MQKVSKELLTTVVKTDVAKHMALRPLPGVVKRTMLGIQGGNVKDAAYLQKLLKCRESLLLSELAEKMAGAMKKKSSIFDTWMLKESSLIQSLAQAYGENMVAEQVALFTKGCNDNDDAQKSMELLQGLYSLTCIRNDIGWYMSEGIISPAMCKEIVSTSNDLCAKLGPKAVELVDSFGIPDHMMHAPIAKNWEQYNTYENNGELSN